ncbi:MAG: hypothetical protein KJ626_08235 [Verrucomicrobia bacterium]|nr:hypothetical protein [Verrucomicrobiota bacterium]
MDAHITVHDRHQVELKLSYPLPRTGGSTSYELDLYIFAPQSLGVHPNTYSKQQFYTDLQSYIRVKTPSTQLARFEDREVGPLAELRITLALAAELSPKDLSPKVENQIKLFCCILKSAVRDFVAFVHRTPVAEDRNRLAGQYVESVRKIAADYRDLRTIIQTPNVSQRTLDIFLFGDEYISLLIEDHTYHLLNGLPPNDECPDPDLGLRLRDLIEGEVQYRRKRRYASIPDEEKDNETLVFRRGVLKKYMASILFLNTKVKTDGLLVQQILFGVAAAIAMIFATGAAFISQSVYGSMTLPVFVTLVVSYIFKDRIKDLLRFHLSRRMTRFLFDHKTHIYDAAGHGVGFCKESFEFTKDRKLPPEVRELRNREHITEIENGWVGEDTLLYRKRIQLFPERVRRVFADHEVDGVNDIMRLNVQEFLRKMDDPKKELFVMDDEGYHRISGARVYYINLILRLVYDGKSTHTRYRLVLNRKGIKRIEAL